MQQSLIPGLRYEDAPAAIDFLCTAFGFERRRVFAEDAPSRIVHHAELVRDGSMVMLGSGKQGVDAPADRLVTPRKAGGVTCAFTVVVDDPDAHYMRSKAAGAEIIRPPHDNEGYPGRSYDARDPEGQC
jgi:uncharacterized glyoxalase superfamily protein PhnB